MSAMAKLKCVRPQAALWEAELATAPFLRSQNLCRRFGRYKIHFSLDDFEKRDIRRAQCACLFDQRTACAAARGQLPHPPGNQVDQCVGITNFDQRLLHVFAVQDRTSYSLHPRKQPKNNTNGQGNCCVSCAGIAASTGNKAQASPPTTARPKCTRLR